MSSMKKENLNQDFILLYDSNKISTDCIRYLDRIPFPVVPIQDGLPNIEITQTPAIAFIRDKTCLGTLQGTFTLDELRDKIRYVYGGLPE